MLWKLLTATALGWLCAASTAGAATVHMWVRTGISNALIETVKAYNAGHPDQIELTQVPFSQMVQKYAAAIAGGEAPDALSLDLIYTPAFAASGRLQDLTEWAKSLPYFQSLTPSHVRLGTYKGNIYGMPLSVETSIFAWNQDLYKKAGLNPDKAPTSWAEITDNAAKISALGSDTYGFYFSAGGCGGCMIFTFAPLVWGSGAQIISDDGRTVTLDTPQMRKAVDIYRNMVAKRYVPAGAATDNGANFLSFANGNIGQGAIGAFAIGNLVTQYPNVHFGVTLIPSVDGRPSSFSGGDNLVVTKGTRNLKAVQDFLAFIYSMEGQKTMAKYGSLPTRGDLSAEVLKDLDPRLEVAVKAIAVAQTPYTTQFNDLINSANSPWASFTHAAIFDTDVDATFKAAQSAMQQIVDDGQ